MMNQGTVLTVYIVAAILGGGLIVFSALGGLHAQGDLDVGDPGHADVGDHGGDGHHGHDSEGAGAFWLPFFSLRFWTYAVGTFGLLGCLLTLFTPTPAPTVALVSAATAAVMGTVASVVVRMLVRADRSSAAGLDDFYGVEGRVTVPVRPGLPGKVRVTVKGDVIDLIAVGASDEEIEAGTPVVVVDMEGSTARVDRSSRVLQEYVEGQKNAN